MVGLGEYDLDTHKTLEDIAKDAQNNPAFFEEVIEHSNITPRTIMQMYMIYKFKWNWNYHGKDAWNQTSKRWCDSGMSKAYAELYDEEVSTVGMYRRLVKFEREHINGKKNK